MQDNLKITWYGTATVKLEINKEKILFDPFIRRNRALRKPDIKDFYDADYILNTHSHFDHLYDAPKILRKNRAVIYGSDTMRSNLKKFGVDIDSQTKLVHPYDCIQTKETSIIVYPSKHCVSDEAWKKKILSDTVKHMYFKSLAKIKEIHREFPMGEEIFGYKVKTKKHSIFVLGSAALGEHVNFQDEIDILLLPYQGRSDMDSYALTLVERLNPKIVILTHFDDAFPPVSQQMNTEKFVKLLQKKRREITVITPELNRAILF